MDPASADVAFASKALSIVSESSQSDTSASASGTPRNGRKGSVKLRTGCITCKFRRVKCDEGKPACLRCTKTGRKCDGYLRRHGIKSSALRPQAVAPIRNSSPRSSPSFFTGWELSEQRALDFYRARSSIRLFRTATTHFWARIIPSLCFQEPAVRHAAIVISDMHEKADCSTKTFLLTKNSQFPTLGPFAVSHYHRALRSLRDWTAPKAGIFAGSASIAVPLLTCALFISIEFMSGNEEAGQMHIHQGRRILASFNGNTASPGAELIRKELVPIFTRLSIASFLFASPPVPIPLPLRWTQPVLESDVPMDFSTAAEAEQVLDEIMEDALRFWRDRIETFHSTPEASSKARALQKDLLTHLKRWQEAFAVLKSTKLEEIDYMTGKMNELYHLTASVFAQRALVTKGTANDQGPAPATFENLVTAAREIVDEYEEEKLKQPTSLAVRKTSQPRLAKAELLERRKQIAMDCDENIWNAWRIVQIAQRASVMEEQRARRVGPSHASHKLR